MPGDTYTPSHRGDSTIFNHEDEVMLHMGDESLRPHAEIEAERAVRSAYDYQQTAEPERQLNGVEYAGLELAILKETREQTSRDGMAA